MGSAARPRRRVHPVAWWLWAAGLATAASRTTDPLLLLLVVAVAALAVAYRQDPAAGRPLTGFLALALVAVGLRVVLTALLGGSGGTTVLLDLPRFALPDPLAGVALGGPVTLEAVAGAVATGLQLAAILVVTGAANALASPRRLLRHLPASLDDLGTTVVVGLSLAPQLVDDARRARAGAALRGRSTRGLRSVARLAVPTLDGALTRSLDLAASMESRGYGRRGSRARWAGPVTAAGLLAVVAGLYGLLDGSPGAWYGLPLLLAGLTGGVAALVAGSGADARTRYRPEPVGGAEVVVAAGGLVAAGALVALGDAPALHPSTSPLAMPSPPLVAVAAVALAGACALAAPEPPAAEEPTR